MKQVLIIFTSRLFTKGISKNPFITFVLAVLFFTSCVPLKKTIYLQDKDEQDTTASFINQRGFNYKVQPGDNLYIKVLSANEKTNIIFNPAESSIAGNAYTNDASIYLNSYTVDEGGYINFPLSGAVFVQDMEVEEIQLTIQNVLNEYLKNSVVIVKLVNFNITLLGEVKKPGTYKVYQQKITIFEAVSMAGDLTDFANRNKIRIVRQNNDGSKIYKIDLTDKEILTSDLYYIKPNDMIYVYPIKGKQFTFANFPYAEVFGFISTLILLLNYFQN